MMVLQHKPQGLTVEKLRKNFNWIVTHGDQPEIYLFKKLHDAKMLVGSCASLGIHRDGRFGYLESDDYGRTTYYGRISSITDNELQQMITMSIQSKLDYLMENIEDKIYAEPYGSWTYREDGLLVGHSDNQLYFKCSNDNLHRVYGVNNTVNGEVQ